MKYVLLAFVALLALAGCKERYTWRQKMTVTVETPSGEVSGSSVSEVSWQEKLFYFPDGFHWNHDETGEAVVVEVTPGRYLFALLKSKDTTEYLGSVAPASISGQQGRVVDPALFDEVRDKRDRAAGVIVVPDYQYPLMVTFADLTDPTSVALIDPADLAASFGAEVMLKSVTLEVTGEPATKGRVEALLNWIGQYPETRLIRNAAPTDFSPEAQLDQGMFISGH
ncbi:hypothetical protein OU426_08815 [Frigidibacter sp. RF13]|uniref:hypothetical protein n=1 Tax=Frigidibacter sp. RF13 TaxID=2997340 RepID=UPI00226EBDB0|nr:hypothetical protein [Frigidibacter sp. RF13]MCY1126954.1 hypothetical protein [Frigidibacter sp. RF13]